MTGTCDEVWANDRNLLCFDGHVLELFGSTDPHRWHVAMRPRIEIVEERKRTRCTIRPERGPWLTFDCDRERVEDLRAFGARLESGFLAR